MVHQRKMATPLRLGRFSLYHTLKPELAAAGAAAVAKADSDSKMVPLHRS